MPDGVDATMQAGEPASLHASPNAVTRQPEGKQLADRNDTMLASRKPRQGSLDRLGSSDGAPVCVISATFGAHSHSVAGVA
jgi:hypothetical protein